MSAGYAARLKDYPNKGVCGLPEHHDTKRAVGMKIKQLTRWIQEAQKAKTVNTAETATSSTQLFSQKGKGNQRNTGGGGVVFFTGAGISTAAGIPDFRGPKGIWTLAKADEKMSEDGKSICQKRKREPVNMDFEAAKPTFTHRSITALVMNDLVDFCITQNVDGLHRRSGLPRAKQAVLHGCAFTEQCEDCSAEFFHDHDVGGMSFQKTGRRCKFCQGWLRDTLLDWEDPLPETDLARAEHFCSKADLVICLGTSLRIEPAGSLPLLAKRFVIVNLQETPKDSKAALIIRAKVDFVMEALMENLGLEDWEVGFEPSIDRVWRCHDDKVPDAVVKS